MCDDAEVVGDDCAELLPHVRKGIIKERIDRLGEFLKVEVEAVVRHVSVHDAPQTLGHVQLRRVGR